MTTIETDVLIVGGGCSGLWVAHELSRLGCPTILVEYGQLAQYASQRNQGWLHTGSLYAIIESDIQNAPELFQLAKTCLSASLRLKRFAKRHAPGAFKTEARCLYLYRDKERAERPIERLRQIGLEPRIWHENLHLLEPILKGSPVTTAVETPDIPMNCGVLLDAVCRRALDFGVRIEQTNIPLHESELLKVDDRWFFRNSETEIASKIVVSTVGPLITQMPFHERLFPQYLPKIQRGVVGILNKRICNNILVFRDRATDFLNLTPFPGLTTINLGAKDREVNGCLEQTGGRGIDGDTIDQVSGFDIDLMANQLSDFCPNLSCPAAGIRSTFYCCHKASNVLGSHPANRQAARHYFWRVDSQSEGLYYLYSGKFTLGLSAAQSLVRAIRGTLPTNRVASPSSAASRRRSSSLIAPSPYYGLQTHYLQPAQDRGLHFNLRLM
jgi:glycine/D-amino acid oxidase-like deaminating enzyme